MECEDIKDLCPSIRLHAHQSFFFFFSFFLNRQIGSREGTVSTLAEVLESWLKKVIDKVVFKSHNVFVLGGQVLDVILIANKALDSRSKNLRLGMACKLYTRIVTV